MKVTSHQLVEELVRFIDLKRYDAIRDRIRAVVLVLEDRTAPEIGQILGRHFRWVQRWVYRYREEGLAGLEDRPLPSQPTKLAKEQVEAFEVRITVGPQVQDQVCRFWLQYFQRILDRKFGAQYSSSGVSRLIKRLGYSYLCTRPRHKKNNPQVMETWKAQAPFLSR